MPIKKTCSGCGKEYLDYNYKTTKFCYCNRECYNQHMVIWNKGLKGFKTIASFKAREQHHNWKGGIRYSSKGYIQILQPNHPRAVNGYVFEHILVMETHLGRQLVHQQVVHHIDFDKTNNNISNLYLFSNNVEHKSYHKFLRDIVINELGCEHGRYKQSI